MISVCPLNAVPLAVAQLAPTHLISLLDPHDMIETPDGVHPDRHLKVGVNDIVVELPGYILPNATHVESVLRFLDSWNASGPLLIHCWAGVSRSTATALIALCLHNDGREEEAAKTIREAAPHAQPNRRIVQIADDLLGRRGRLIQAIAAMGPAQFATEGKLFTVPLRLG